MSAFFKTALINPGVYTLFVEYRNYEVFEEEVYLFKGYNKYQLCFP